MIRKWSGAFVALFTVGLAIIALWLAFGTDSSLSHGRIAVMTVIAVAVVGAGSTALLFLYHSMTVRLPRILQRLAVWVTFRTVRKAISQHRMEIEPTAIASYEGDLRIGLPVGSNDGLVVGDVFAVVNPASQHRWGELELAEIEDDACTCSVYNRNNPEFWDALERRVDYDPSPPRGIVVRKEIPEEYLIDWLRRLLRTTGG